MQPPNFNDMLDVLKRIAEMTNPDNPESYRSDDREGCLDTVHFYAESTIAAQPSRAVDAETAPRN